MRNRKAKRRIVIVSGGFDPIHVGHIRYIKAASRLGDTLFAIANSDAFLKRKKNYAFMSADERQEILRSIKGVDRVVLSIDKDQTVSATLRQIHKRYGAANKLIFAKGGDRTKENIPEMGVCSELNIEVVFGVGGGKAQSSSHLVKRIKRRKIAK
jgi:D-beta-D-heptose 7-phosphate kinase/D-beta-D-heptose 1-phosphate adenosyltransferase